MNVYCLLSRQNYDTVKKGASEPTPPVYTAEQKREAIRWLRACDYRVSHAIWIAKQLRSHSDRGVRAAAQRIARYLGFDARAIYRMMDRVRGKKIASYHDVSPKLCLFPDRIFGWSARLDTVPARRTSRFNLPRNVGKGLGIGMGPIYVADLADAIHQYALTVESPPEWGLDDYIRARPSYYSHYFGIQIWKPC